MNKGLLCLWLSLFLISCTSSVNTEEQIVYEAEILLEKDIVKPQHYIAYSASQAIEIDGQALEANWASAKYTNEFIDIEGVKQPKYRTQVKMLWDAHYLYVYAKLEEPHIWADIKKHDAIIFHNNDFEVFIDPTGDTYNYTEIEVNALNTTWDLRLNKSYRFGGHANDYYEIEGLKTAVHLEGTLNNGKDVDRYWSVEMAIPMEVILQRKHHALKHPKQGDYWRINFSRVQWEHDLIGGVYSLKKENGKRLPEYNWVWSNQGLINMHLPERWGYLEFSEKVVGGEEEKNKPIPNLLNQQVAYALLQQIRFGAHKQLLDLAPTQTRKLKDLKIDQNTFNAVFMKTHLGFEIHLNNLSSKEAFVINEEGKFKLL